MPQRSQTFVIEAFKEYQIEYPRNPNNILIRETGVFSHNEPMISSMDPQVGSIKTWGTIDSAAKWLKTLGIGTMKLEAGKWMPNQKGLSL